MTWKKKGNDNIAALKAFMECKGWLKSYIMFVALVNMGSGGRILRMVHGEDDYERNGGMSVILVLHWLFGQLWDYTNVWM